MVGGRPRSPTPAATSATPLLRNVDSACSMRSQMTVESDSGLSGALEEGREPTLSVDPLGALRDVRAPMSSGALDHVKIEEARERYMHHLGQYRLVSAGYVPNLVPILRWHTAISRSPSVGSSLFPSPTSSAGAGVTPTTGGLRGSGSKNRLGPLVEHHESDRPLLASPEAATASAAKKKRGMFRPGSIRSSVVNVTAAALGAGALALPRAMYYSGMIFGPLFMLTLAGLSCVSIKVIVQLVEVTRKNSYEEIAKVAFGPWFALLVELNIILFCFGTAVAYMITVGQISHQVVDAVVGPVGAVWWSGLLSPNSMLFIVTVFVLLPLSVLDSINDLRFASLFGVSCVLYLIAVVVYIFFAQGASPTLLVEDGFSGWRPKHGFIGCFKMLSLAIFAFCCQPNVPSIYTELERKSFGRMEKVSRLAMVLCLVVYLVMGVAGFLAFGEDTAGNVLSNLQPFLCKSDPVVISGFGCMAFAVTMAFPLNIFPIRFAVETALFYRNPNWNTRGVRFGIAACAVFSALGVAIAIPQINVIFELIGATTGSFVCFIGPGLLFCRLGPGSLWSSAKMPAVLLIVVGVLFLVLGTYSSVQDVMEQFSGSAGPAAPQTCAASML